MADSNLDVNVIGRDELSPLLNNLESRLIRFVGAVSSAIAGIRVAAFPVTATGDFERELANVQKTTEFTKTSIGLLAGELKNLSLRMNVSLIDLTKIAAAAGQQGLGGTGVEGIAKFTESVARMAAVLDITSEQAATDVGKIMNVFHLSINDVERIASSFNEVSNNSTASGAQLLDIVRRIGDAAGTINLKQSLGLAASGIDLGLSPEVVGTSFNSIFIQMRSKATQFAKLMNASLTDSAKINAKEWIETVEADGIGAFKQYLSALRKLDSQSQADAINKLSGQGRIAGLMNKLVQDVNNSVLNKNLLNANTGFESGLSAIREQQKVLSTFNEQAKITKNSLTTLATEAGERLIPQLTAYMAQLSAALQAPGLKSFVAAIGDSFLDLVQLIAGVIKGVAGMNVNWENFIAVAKVFLGMRIAEFFLTLATRLPIVSSLFQGITASATGAAGAVGGAVAAQVSGLSRLGIAAREYAAAKLAQAAAEDAAARAGRVAQSRERDYLQSGRQEFAAGRLAQVAGANASAGASNTTNVRARAAAAEEALQNTLAQRRAAATQQSEARIAQIEQNYRGQRRVAQIAARDAEIAAEQAALTRRLAGYEGYYGRQIALAQANGAAQVAQAEANEARLTQVQRTAEQQRAALARAASVRRIQLEQSETAQRGAQQNLDQTRAATDRARQSLFSFGTIAAGIGSAIGLVVRALSGAFLWFTLIYTVLDALGITKDVGGWFLKLSDALGLTSEAARKAAQENKNLSEELKKQINHVKDLSDAYDKLKDSSTGALDPAKVKALGANLGSESPEQQAKAVKELGENLVAAYSQVEDAKSANNSVAAKARNAPVDLQALKKNVDAAEREYTRLKRAEDIGPFADASDLTAAEDKFNKLSAAYKVAQEAAAKLGETAKTSGTEVVAQAQSNQQVLAQLVTGFFTNESAALYEKFVKPIRDAQTIINALDKKRAEQLQAQQALDPNDKAGRQAAEARALITQAEIDKAVKALVALQTQYATTRDAMLGQNGITAAVRNSILGLTAFSNQSAEVVRNVGRALSEQKKAGATLTGVLAPQAPKSDKSTGDNTFNSKGNEESEARKLARARLEFAKAEHAAALNLLREYNDQLQKEEQHQYDNGLQSIAEYFADRKKLQLQNNQEELKALRLDRQAAERERANRKSDGAAPSELMKYDTDIKRINGQIAVLQEKRKGIAADTSRDLADASRAFAANVNSEQLRLADTLGVTDFGEFFQRNLKAAADQYRVFWNKLKSEGGEGAQQLMDSLEQVARLEALTKVFDKISQSISRSYSSLDLWLGRLDILQQRGIITTAQYEAQAKRYRAQAAAMIQSDIDTQQAQMRAMAQAQDTGTEAYKKLGEAIEQNKLKLAQLLATGNQVAIAIQQSLQTGIKNALDTLLGGREQKQLSSIQQQVLQDNADSVRRLEDNLAFLQRARDGVISGYAGEQSNVDAQIAKTRGEIENLRKQSAGIREETTESVLQLIARAAKSVALNLAQAVQEQATKSLAQNAMKSLGGMEGGIGGVIASALGGGGERGDSPMNPLYVKDADSTKPLDPKDAAKDPIKEAFEAAKEKVKSVFDDITGSLKDTLGGLWDSLSSILSGLGDSLSSLFGGGGGGGLGGIGGFIASLFHTGGVVGSTFSPRRVDAGMFMHAARYHTGGIAGLAPDEVPAILRKGEEVLTADDPRHRSNASAEGSTNVTVNVDMKDGKTSVEADNANAKEFGKRMADAVKAVIANEQRPGGLLSGR